MQNQTPPVISASNQVEDSYYGQPVIKAPHWRWLVIFYFFLGGLTGASFSIATVADFFSKDQALVRTARYLSFAALVPCPPLLILDLGRPERALNMLRIIKLKSPMSLGSWALAFLGIFATAATVLQALTDFRGRRVMPGFNSVVSILGLPFSVFLSGYTGVLLAATNVPLWWRSSPLLAPTFMSSAYATSLASLSIILDLGGDKRKATQRRMAGAELACASAELALFTALLIRLGRIGRPLTRGRLGLIFWPVTYFGGVILPFVAHLRAAITGESGSSGGHRSVRILVVLGSFSLRALMIFAGRKSAELPEDYFEMTKGACSKERQAPGFQR